MFYPVPYTIAVISDIHANLHAFEAVLADIEDQFPEITEMLCPGDIANYCVRPSEVIDRLLSEKRITAVTKGNHDHACGGGGRDIANFDEYIADFNKYAQEAIKWTVNVLTPEEKTFLYQLPSNRTVTHKEFETRIAIIHGSPTYPLGEYILPNTPQQKDLFPFMLLFDIGVLLLGHTHIPFIDKQSKESKELLIINPGSIGQPRDKDPRASYAVLDLETHSAEIIRVNYDIDIVQKEIINAGLPEFLADRLQKGV
jgi:putative phosphoesterase